MLSSGKRSTISQMTCTGRLLTEKLVSMIPKENKTRSLLPMHACSSSCSSQICNQDLVSYVYMDMQVPRRIGNDSVNDLLADLLSRVQPFKKQLAEAERIVEKASEICLGSRSQTFQKTLDTLSTRVETANLVSSHISFVAKFGKDHITISSCVHVIDHLGPIRFLRRICRL